MEGEDEGEEGEEQEMEVKEKEEQKYDKYVSNERLRREKVSDKIRI